MMSPPRFCLWLHIVELTPIQAQSSDRSRLGSLIQIILVVVFLIFPCPQNELSGKSQMSAVGQQRTSSAIAIYVRYRGASGHRMSALSVRPFLRA
jgi:hypothetical protein